ncbi:hypothetical protein [Pseudofrankia sp. DC12]|uniref:hypothetical protein n=1 Tax=Pseudofrankia sp. DC12 TaxID=683315 RepID=UPI0012FCF590|nr:hypothetical protein [Pseudofrankia sp. DC12]
MPPWQYRNKHRLFEIKDTREFGVHIYGAPRGTISFLQAAWIYDPSTIDRSLLHDGSGDEPGVKDDDGKWDTRPHRARITHVDWKVLSGWADLLDEPGTHFDQARAIFPVNSSTAIVLEKIASAPRLGALDFHWTPGWHETGDRQKGYFERRPGFAGSWQDVILQGPHLSAGTALFQQPNPTAKNHQDYKPIDLEEITENFIPRTKYQRASSVSAYREAYTQWNGHPSCDDFRLSWRAMADPATARTLHSAIIPPGPSHVLGIFSLTVEDPLDLAVSAATTSSLIADFFIKVTTVANIKIGVLSKLPHVRGHALEQEIVLRTLRLNCLVRPYAPLWNTLHSAEWKNDRWVPGAGTAYRDRSEVGEITSSWQYDTPLRRPADRRQALIEIDAIVAIMLGFTADELAAVYRTQFPILRQNERRLRFDSFGREVPAELVKELDKEASGGHKIHTLQAPDRTYVGPFFAVDRERDLRLAHEHFSRLVAARQSQSPDVAGKIGRGVDTA